MIRNMQSVYSEFKKIVSSSPDVTAVKDDIRTLTYAELDALADTIAAGFPGGKPACVGIVMDHSVEMIASILAVLNTGAAYVPSRTCIYSLHEWYHRQSQGCTGDQCQCVPLCTSFYA